ncbi:hypothetical protein EPA93_35375 [Ktedonosporobacter rubrisoli]|uniref:Uncharacterized protein n=1 Tax=Ktedonosporobacter rubrisoli TaxID=2509675 RepID=A0A4P6JYR8_KTERU|nr:hypothetical protein [Ktedonosporobacter rubrisoli]QBD80968.1 hypothetical protein EPA93_35375 [Ktedonosporobacter rubrisoli]
MHRQFKDKQRAAAPGQQKHTETIYLVVDRQAVHPQALARLQDPEQAGITYETWGETHWRVQIEGFGRILSSEEAQHFLQELQDAHSFGLLKSFIMPHVLLLQGPAGHLLYGEDLLWRQRSFLTVAPEQR